MARKHIAVGLAALGAAGDASAQIGGALGGPVAGPTPPVALSTPVAPGAFPGVSAPAPVPPNALGIAPRPPLPTNNTLASFLGVSADQREYRRRQQCNTPGGAVLANIRAPFSRLSGGLIPPFCPTTPSLAELQDPGAVGAAAKVKQDRAGAEQRLKAVKYLAGVDCHYWPEAEEALIGAMRADRNECVRYQAVLVLGKGCCCTKKVIKALMIAAEGSDCDGNPPEKSPRVRAAAQMALERCLQQCSTMESFCEGRENCGKEDAPAPLPTALPDDRPQTEKPGAPALPPAKEGAPGMLPSTAKPTAAKPKDPLAGLSGVAFYEAVGKMSGAKLADEARKLLVKLGPPQMPAEVPVNELDFEAAGLPTADDAHRVSPKPSNLLDLMTRSPEETSPKAAVNAAPEFAAFAPTLPARGTAAPPRPFVAPKAAPAPTLLPASLPAPVIQLNPLPPAVASPVLTPLAPAPITEPIPVAVPTGKSALVPINVPLASVPAPLAAPVLVPVAVAPVAPAAPRETAGQAAMRLFGEICPVGQLAAAVDRVSAADAKATPGLMDELKLAAETSPEPQLRAACARALGRCGVAAPAPAVVVPAAVAAPAPVVVEPVRSLGGRETAGQSVMRLFNDVCPVSELKAAVDKVMPADVKGTPGLTEELVAAATKSPEAELRAASAKALVRGGVYTPAVKAAFEAISHDADAAVRVEGERGRTLAK